MDILVEQGVSYADCVHKIVEKYGIYYNIIRKKEIRTGGIFGLFSREGVEVEFSLYKNASQSDEDFEKRRNGVLAVTGKNPKDVVERAAEKVKQEEQESQGEKILEELREIKEKIESGGAKKDEHPSLVRAGELLKANDFSDAYTAGILDRARKELPLEKLDNFDAVQDAVLEWIGESIAIYRESGAAERGRILALVGPTGVGKTTTIAKLAAKFGIENSPPLPVRMITIDAFRIGAKEQIEKYGSIMDIPVSYVDNRRDLKKEIALYQDETGLTLIDTIGKSPKDSARLGEMKELLDACGSGAEIHLALSASTKTSDIIEILRQFEPFNYRAVLLTKLDETIHTGNVISALAERKKPVSWITDGQKVPSDIKKASVIRFLNTLDGFRVNREKIEKRFPAGEAEQF